MKTFEEIARDLVARWEHGDDEHRKWLRDTAVPDLVKAFEYVEALTTAALKPPVLRAEVHDAVIVDVSKMTLKEVEARVFDALTTPLKLGEPWLPPGSPMPKLEPLHVRHDDVLYPHWLKVRTVLQRTGATEGSPSDTCGAIADAVIAALRPQLLNDTAEMTRLMHVGPMMGGWGTTLLAFARMALDVGYPCTLRALPNAQEKDGWRLSHALLIELPTGQVSWRVTAEQVAAFRKVGIQETFPPHAVPGAFDGHDRDTKYRRLEDFANSRREPK